jgi:hypothetical protein
MYNLFDLISSAIVMIGRLLQLKSMPDDDDDDGIDDDIDIYDDCDDNSDGDDEEYDCDDEKFIDDIVLNVNTSL